MTTNSERGQAVKNLPKGTMILLALQGSGAWIGHVWNIENPPGCLCAIPILIEHEHNNVDLQFNVSPTATGLIGDLALATQEKDAAK